VEPLELLEPSELAVSPVAGLPIITGDGAGGASAEPPTVPRFAGMLGGGITGKCSVLAGCCTLSDEPPGGRAGARPVEGAPGATDGIDGATKPPPDAPPDVALPWRTGR
jgi:hypothetical protein